MVHHQLVQSASLLFACILVYFISRFERNDLPTFVIGEMVAQCTFDPPGDYRDGPYARSIHWCNTGDMAPTQGLITHLKLFSAGMDVAFAAEFGSHVRVAYVVQRDILLLNPRIASRSAEAIFCQDEVGGTVLSQLRAASVEVEYLNERREPRTAWFHRGESCRIQTVISIL